MENRKQDMEEKLLDMLSKKNGCDAILCWAQKFCFQWRYAWPGVPSHPEKNIHEQEQFFLFSFSSCWCTFVIWWDREEYNHFSMGKCAKKAQKGKLQITWCVNISGPAKSCTQTNTVIIPIHYFCYCKDIWSPLGPVNMYRQITCTRIFFVCCTTARLFSRPPALSFSLSLSL